MQNYHSIEPAGVLRRRAIKSAKGERVSPPLGLNWSQMLDKRLAQKTIKCINHLDER